MARELKDKSHLSETLETRLRTAVNLRNGLAHNYFYERARDLLHSGGREKLIKELHDVANFLDKLDKELTETLQLWLNKMGVTNKKIQFEFHSFLAEKNTEDKIFDSIEAVDDDSSRL